MQCLTSVAFDGKTKKEGEVEGLVSEGGQLHLLLQKRTYIKVLRLHSLRLGLEFL